MSAAGIPGAFDMKCGVETVAQVTVESAQNGRQRTSAVVRPDRTDKLNVAVTLSIKGSCSAATPIVFSARAVALRARAAPLSSGRKRLT